MINKIEYININEIIKASVDFDLSVETRGVRVVSFKILKLASVSSITGIASNLKIFKSRLPPECSTKFSHIHPKRSMLPICRHYFLCLFTDYSETQCPIETIQMAF